MHPHLKERCLEVVNDGGLGRSGHHSPLALYDAETDSALLLDVARYKYPPSWLPIPALFTAMSGGDPIAEHSRGWLVVSGEHGHFALGKQTTLLAESQAELSHRPIWWLHSRGGRGPAADSEHLGEHDGGDGGGGGAGAAGGGLLYRRLRRGPPPTLPFAPFCLCTTCCRLLRLAFAQAKQTEGTTKKHSLAPRKNKRTNVEHADLTRPFSPALGGGRRGGQD